MDKNAIAFIDEQDVLVQRRVAAGRVRNACEALILRDRLAAGLDQADRGELADGDAADVIRGAFARFRDAALGEPRAV